MRFNRKTVEVMSTEATEVISAADVKTALRITDTDHDALIARYIAACTLTMKDYLKVGLQQETHVMTMDGFSQRDFDDGLDDLGAGVHQFPVSYVSGAAGFIDLPYAPIQSVTHIKTFGRDNTEATFSAFNYELDARGGRAYLNEGQTWPTNLRHREAVKVTYVSGYGAANVPKPIVEVIGKMAEAMYEGCSQSEVIMNYVHDLSPYKRLDPL